jgi:hypothetical protein
MRTIGAQPIDYTRTGADEELCRRLLFASEL